MSSFMSPTTIHMPLAFLSPTTISIPSTAQTLQTHCVPWTGPCARLAPPQPQRSVHQQQDIVFNSWGRARRRSLPRLAFSNKAQAREDEEGAPKKDEKAFLKRELARLESMEELVAELETDDLSISDDDDDDAADDDTWLELFQTLPEEADLDELQEMERFLEESDIAQNVSEKSAASLEQALLQGVVPASAGVGSGCLPGDFGFDPLELSTKDYINRMQVAIMNWLPERDVDDDGDDCDGCQTPVPLLEDWRPRAPALILRDYREAEIRHSRLAMLAAVFWPLQEMLDRLVLDEDQLGPLLFTSITLPYIPLAMTATMLLLGYLDIYSKSIKDLEDMGDAFLPGDCFWDPLSILQGAPDRMKRNMQERELFNGRMAMLAVAVYVFEETTTGLPLISIPGNELLFEPAYQVPFIQHWLDSLFQSPSAALPSGIDFVETMREVLEEEKLREQVAEQVTEGVSSQ